MAQRVFDFPADNVGLAGSVVSVNALQVTMVRLSVQNVPPFDGSQDFDVSVATSGGEQVSKRFDLFSEAQRFYTLWVQRVENAQ